MATKKVSQGTRAPKRRAEKPVSEAIRRAAERSGICRPVDADDAIRNLNLAFEEIFDAQDAPCAEHDHFILVALRRLRLVQDMLRGSVEVAS